MASRTIIIQSVADFQTNLSEIQPYFNDPRRKLILILAPTLRPRDIAGLTPYLALPNLTIQQQSAGYGINVDTRGERPTNKLSLSQPIPRSPPIPIAKGT